MLGVNISIIQNGKILLTKREDFEVWCLPGGAVDAGESIAQAAIREAREETGLQVELTRLIGLYSRPGWPGAGAHIASFVGHPIGGELKADPSEVIDIGYFAPNEIPADLLWWHGQRIKDAFNGIGGSIVWSQTVNYPFEKNLSRAELYQRRDDSELSRRDFYLETFGKPSNVRETLEIGPDKNQES